MQDTSIIRLINSSLSSFILVLSSSTNHAKLSRAATTNHLISTASSSLALRHGINKLLQVLNWELQRVCVCPGRLACTARIASLPQLQAQDAPTRLVSIHVVIVNSLSVVSVYAVLVPLAHELSYNYIHWILLFSGDL